MYSIYVNMFHPICSMPLGGGPVCGVCQKNVYFNEERRAVGKVFHVTCFKCGMLYLSLFTCLLFCN